MPTHTLFVDESGKFELDRGYWPEGLRLVGGLLVPLSARPAETEARRVVGQALAEDGFAWWTAPIHGSELLWPPRMAATCLLLDSVPERARGQARMISKFPRDRGTCFRKMRELGLDILRCVQRALGKWLIECGGSVFTVAEYGRDGFLSGGARASRYPPMLGALLEAVQLDVAGRGDGDARVEAVIAHRPGPWAEKGGEPWSRYLGKAAWASSRSGGQSLDRVELDRPLRPSAEEWAGLQLADVVVHRLGPGGSQDALPARNYILSRTLDSVRSEASRFFDIKEPMYEEHDAGEGHRSLEKLLAGFPEDAVFSGAKHSLDELVQEPPFSLFPASLEQARLEVDELEGFR